MARASAPPLALSSRTAAGSSAGDSDAATTRAPPSLALTSADATKEICMLYLRAGTGYFRGNPKCSDSLGRIQPTSNKGPKVVTAPPRAKAPDSIDRKAKGRALRVPSLSAYVLLELLGPIAILT